ncbi:MAG TPA: alpha/beta fold hydrolase [Chloroflexota bacterium]
MGRRSDVAHVAGTRLFYEVAGTGTPVVLIHGFSLDSRMWDDQMDAFAARHQVIRYDMRGTGRSSLPGAESYTESGDLKALLDHLGVESAAIVGLSAGGGVALDFALTYPEAARALVLVDSNVGGWTWSARWDDGVVPVWSAARDDGIEAAKERWLALPLFTPALTQPDVARRLKDMVSDYSGWHWLHDNPQQSLDPPAIQHLGDIACPTLIVIGERDEPDFHAIATAFQQGIPHAETAVIPAAGHMSNMEAPAQFNDIVLRFLSR